MYQLGKINTNNQHGRGSFYHPPTLYMCYLIALLSQLVLLNLIFVFVSCVSYQIQSEKCERNTAGQYAKIFFLVNYRVLWAIVPPQGK